MLLPGTFIFYDFEASGLDPGTAEPLEIAALKVVDGVVTERLVSLLRPRNAVPPEVLELTGLDEKKLREAPEPRQLAQQVSAFFGCHPRVAHNARYDEQLLRGLLGRSPEGDVADSLELSHFLRPDLRSHALGALARTLGVSQSRSHRAEADAEVMLQVVQRLLAQAGARPAQLRVILSALRKESWPWYDAVEGASRNRPSTPPKAPLAPEQVDDGALQALDLFSPERPGSLTAELVDYEPRPQQLEMVQAVEQAFATGRHAMIEAPTGVGKSLAYLVPAALFARRHGVPVVVSTNTRALQDQLRSQDIRMLARALGGPLRWQVVKGRANYVCMVRWRDLLQTLPASASGTERLALAYLGAVAQGPTDGEIDDIHPFMRQRLPELASLAERVRGSDCNGQRGHEACPTGRVARNAARAHLLVINHAVLMAGSQLLPHYEYAVVDEAHALEDRALSVLSTALKGAELLRLAQRLGTSIEKRGLARSLARSAAKAKTPCKEAERLAWTGAYLLSAHRKMARFASERIFKRRAAQQKDGYAHDTRELALEGLPPGAAGALDDRLEDLDRALTEGRQAVDSALRWLAKHGDTSPQRRVLERALGDTKFALFEHQETLVSLREEPDRSELRVLAQRGSALDQWTLRADPLCVAKEVHEHLFASLKVAILTSATLSLHDSGRYLASRLGYPQDEAEQAAPLLALASPWDLSGAAVNLVVEDLPAVGEVAERVHAMARLVADVAGPLGGRTMVLFSAAARMRRTAEAARPLLAASGLTLLEQHRDGSVEQLLRRMRWDGSTVLFGLASFWTGIDIAGPALTCVVIERVPFASKNRPIVAARMAEESEGYGGFERYLLPAALLDLRQGAGRLLRRGTDRGLVVLCHEHLSSKKYAAAALAMLPGDVIHNVEAAAVGPAVVDAANELGLSLVDGAAAGGA